MVLGWGLVAVKAVAAWLLLFRRCCDPMSQTGVDSGRAAFGEKAKRVGAHISCKN